LSYQCRSDVAGNFATFITLNTEDEEQDDILKINNEINTDVKVDDAVKNSGNDDLKGINDDKGTLSTFQEENNANSSGKNNPNKNFAPDTKDDAKTDDFHNDNFVSNNDKQSNNEGDQESNKNGKLNHDIVDEDNPTSTVDRLADDFKNDNFVSNSNDLSANVDDFQTKNTKSNSGEDSDGIVDEENPTSTVDRLADDFKNDNFVSNSNDLSANVDDFQTKNTKSNSGEDSETSSQSIDPSTALGSIDDYKMGNFVPKSNEQSSRGSDPKMSTTSTNFVDGTSTEIGNNNHDADAVGRSDDFQNDDFMAQNNNLEIKVDDVQGTNKEDQSVTHSGGTMKNFESFVNEYNSVLDDFATGDDTDEAMLNNSGMVSRAALHFVYNDKLESYL
jgi:hypothetical protein